MLRLSPVFVRPFPVFNVTLSFDQCIFRPRVVHLNMVMYISYGLLGFFLYYSSYYINMCVTPNNEDTMKYENKRLVETSIEI